MELLTSKNEDISLQQTSGPSVMAQQTRKDCAVFTLSKDRQCISHLLKGLQEECRKAKSKRLGWQRSFFWTLMRQTHFLVVIQNKAREGNKYFFFR